MNKKSLILILLLGLIITGCAVKNEQYMRNLAEKVVDKLPQVNSTDQIPFIPGLPSYCRIAFEVYEDEKKQIEIIGADGNDLQQLITDDSSGFPAWSPDGTHIAYVSDAEGNNQIYILDIQTGEIEQLTFGASSSEFPSWSPDGKQIAFSSDRNDEQWDIFVMDADGKHVQRLTEDSSDEKDPA